MTIPSYPSTLPPPLRSGYQDQSGEGRSFFGAQSGLINVSRNSQAVMDVIPYTTMLTRVLLGRFDRFYLEDTKKGSLPFLMPEPLLNGFAILDENGDELLDENGDTLLYSDKMLVMFADQGLPARAADYYDGYRVSFRLWRLPT